MTYDELPTRLKAKTTSICLENNITRPDDIRTAYNDYAEGWNIFHGRSESPQRSTMKTTIPDMIKATKWIILTVLSVIIGSCANKADKDVVIEAESIPNTPQCVILLQPYGNFKTAEAEALIPSLEYNFGTYLYGYWQFKVLPSVKHPEDAYLSDINRYKATAILNHELKLVARWDTLIVGLTHADICMDTHGKRNYGIIGCSYKNNRVCIVSDKRLRNKNDLWKPVLHEFVHAFYGSGHCPVDNDSCIMQDGKGKGDFTN